MIYYGESAAVALTGSTISNDPTQWYLTEISNVAGCQNHLNVVVYDNKAYLQKQRWLICKEPISQQEKIDYKIDLSVNQIYNGQATVCRINNLLFYILLVVNTSPIRGTQGYNLLCFCLDTGETYFLDFGVDTYGVYYSFIEGFEDRLYLLCRDGLYAAFEGTDPITSYIRTKTYHLGIDYIEKFWWVLLLKVVPVDGLVKFTIDAKTEKAYSYVTYETAVETEKIIPTNINSVNLVFVNTSGEQIVFSKQVTSRSDISDLTSKWFNIRTSGKFLTMYIKETSNGVHDLGGFTIKGQLARQLL